MRSFTTASALAATAGLAVLSSAPASGYVLPQAIGDEWFAEKAAKEASRLASTKDSRAENFAASPAAKRDETKSIKLNLVHSRQVELNTPEKVKAFALRQKSYVESKYGHHSKVDKRQTIGLTGVGPDTFYYAQVSVGTPAQNFNAILDTGSADFWLADTSCNDEQCSGIALYNPDASSTRVASQTPFQIVYGSGAVCGQLFADTVSLAGYTTFNQTVAGVDQLAEATIQAPASGIMGMGFQALTTSGATPFWEVLAETNKLPVKAFTFQLQRNALARPSDLNAGGVFTLGEIDTNQYSGDITYISLPNTRTGRAGYWAIPMDSIEVGSQTINTAQELAAIDTGTTLIGGPIEAVSRIYSSISGAQRVDLGGSSGSADMGYWAYPCSADPTISMTFGGREFQINSQDFNAGVVDRSGRYCLGAIFATDLGQGAPEWIVGDSFLKNVFSVYDYNNGSPRIGFANLKGSSAQNAPITSGAVPSGTAANQIPTGTSGSESTAPVGPPSISIDQSAATNTAIAGGSGLPAPVAAASNAASTPSLSTGGNSNSRGNTSGANKALTATGLLAFVGAAAVGAAMII